MDLQLNNVNISKDIDQVTLGQLKLIKQDHNSLFSFADQLAQADALRNSIDDKNNEALADRLSYWLAENDEDEQLNITQIQGLEFLLSNLNYATKLDEVLKYAKENEYNGLL